MEERIQKLIAAAGYCSRRTAEEWLKAGRVTVNGEVADVGRKADAERDRVLVDGRELTLLREKKIYIMLHKPKGYLSANADARGRKTVLSLVGDCGGRVYPVGRLDLMSEGLLLLTSDGDFSQSVTHPSRQVNKNYRVRVSGDAERALPVLRAMRELDDGTVIRPADVEILSREGDGAWLSFIIHEGKNRQIRRMCRAAGLKVLRLIRTEVDGVRLGDLPPGKWRYLTEEEISRLSAAGKEREETKRVGTSVTYD